GQNANYTAINNTLANVRGIGDYQGSGIGRTNGIIQTIENNILVDNRIGLDRIPRNNSYNVLYNTTNYNETIPGTGEVVNIDPLTNGLSYIPRVEDSSPLKTLGRSGTQVGAQIVKRIGVSGRLYGESGWDTITNENLWPWPNEDILKSKISSYNLHEVNGKRGFCSDGNGLYGGPITLTSYIWEYLGNPCPIEFYGTTALPAVTTNAAASVNSSSATLNGTINPNGISTAYYFEYGTDMSYGMTTAIGNAGSGNDDVDVSADITGLNDLTYYHFRLVATNTGGASYGSDKYFRTHELPVPAVGKLTDTNISSTGATTGVYVIDNGGASITECGMVYSTSESPTTDDNKIVASDCSGETISLTGLSPDTTYYVRAYAISINGTGYSAETSFTTESAPFSVSLVNPKNDDTDVLVDTSISVTFSDSIDPSTITNESFSLSNGTINVSGTVSCNNTTATFTPASNLDYNTMYTATVTKDAKNVSGDPLQDDYIWSFTTGISAQVALWTFGTTIDATDGDIEFHQTWNNAHSDFFVHDITYQSDGASVKGWILQPKTSGPHPVLIWNRDGSGHWEEITWHANDGRETLYKNEVFLYAAAGYVVVCTQYRGNGRTVSLGHDDRFNPTFPPTASDFASGTDPFIEDYDNDYRGGVEINDVINLLPLIQKLSATNGNNGLKINLNLSQIAMMGVARGGTETYIALRELSEKGRYGALPSISAAIIKGAISHYPDWLKDVFEEKTVWHELYGSNTFPPRNSAAAISGNFDWTYPDDFDDIADPGYLFWSFFPETGSFPSWDDTDLKNDKWIESGFSVHPDYPYYKVYSEEYYARSAILWDYFWSHNQIPVLLLHSKGDTQVLWNDAQEMYNKVISVGNSSLYTLKLFDDSDDNCEACSFLRSAIGKKLYCDHWLIENNYGFDDVISWLSAQFATDSEVNLTMDCNSSPAFPGQTHPVTLGIDTKGLTLSELDLTFIFDPSQLTPADASAISLAAGGTVQTSTTSPGNCRVQLTYPDGFKGTGDVIKINTTIASNLCNLSATPSTLLVGIAVGAKAYDANSTVFEAVFTPESCDIDLYCCSPDGDIAPLGSPDGQVNVGDALVGLRFALGLEPGHPTTNELCHGDVAPLDTINQPSPDGEITVGDALVILRKALGLISF
ncbi:MAG: Ig-like domain-containing protein, partial [Deltaproteobacteria bacterium]|nr:Ig-like domain-containing protein [Deltaproteobacteria bacterium]